MNNQPRILLDAETTGLNAPILLMESAKPQGKTVQEG